MTASSLSDFHLYWVISPLYYESIIFFDVDRYEAWRDAMKAEIQALHTNNTWSLIPFQPLMKVVGNH